jgi:hypothetical protein
MVMLRALSFNFELNKLKSERKTGLAKNLEVLTPE